MEATPSRKLSAGASVSVYCFLLMAYVTVQTLFPEPLMHPETLTVGLKPQAPFHLILYLDVSGLGQLGCSYEETGIPCGLISQLCASSQLYPA